MTLTRLIPAPLQEFSRDAETTDTLASLYCTPQQRWLRLNFVASVNGNVAGEDGTSHGLTSVTDRKILGAIRRLADIVLVGASSVRTEGYFMPKLVPLAIVTGSGDLSGHHIPHDVAQGRLIVLCPPDAETKVLSSLDGRAATIISLNGPRMSPRSIIEVLRSRGLENIVCEGGPSLAAQLIDANLVDEVCLSTSPVVNGTRTPLLSGLSRSVPMRLDQLLIDHESVLYARWGLRT